MPGKVSAVRAQPLFKRSTVVFEAELPEEPLGDEMNPQPASSSPYRTPAHDFRVLVVNASQEMAKEITLQITLKMPGSSIMYAPTIDLARWILKRRQIDLVIASPMLPDGRVERLHKDLKCKADAPDIVVVGDVKVYSAEVLEHSGYEFAKLTRLEKPQSTGVDNVLEELGADIRNDLNNPLQEIVAMAFVAKANGELAEGTEGALEAIQQAAKNMASVVNGLEDKIKRIVTPHTTKNF